MSKFVCDSGTLTITGTQIENLCLNNVSIDISADTVSYLCMGDSSWQSSAAGTKSWTCSFETALDDTLGVDLTNTIGEAGTLTFETTDGLAYTSITNGAIITSISISAPSDDYATVSWEATGTGALGEA